MKAEEMAVVLSNAKAAALDSMQAPPKDGDWLACAYVIRIRADAAVRKRLSAQAEMEEADTANKYWDNALQDALRALDDDRKNKP